MHNGLTINGAEGNEIIVADGISAEASSITIKGRNNRIVIDRNCILRNARVVIESDGNSVSMGVGVRFTGSIIQKRAPGNRVVLGAGSSFGQVNFVCGEGTLIDIGEDCMFAWGIEVRSTDSHAIFDVQSDKRLNPGEDIVVGRHVWVAAKSTLLKGARVSSGCWSVWGCRELALR